MSHFQQPKELYHVFLDLIEKCHPAGLGFDWLPPVISKNPEGNQE